MSKMASSRSCFERINLLKRLFGGNEAELPSDSFGRCRRLYRSEAYPYKKEMMEHGEQVVVTTEALNYRGD